MIRPSSRGSAGLRSVTDAGVSFRIDDNTDTPVSPCERLLAGRHLVENHTQGKEIGSGVDRCACGLFRRHIRDRPDNAAFGRGRAGRHRARTGRRKPRIDQLCQTEIENLHATGVPGGANHDVGRLEVAVRDPFLVCRRDGVGEGNGDREKLVYGKAALWNRERERAALDHFHGQEQDSVTFLDRIDRDDVGVVQGCSGAGFLLEPAKSLGIVGKCRRQHLDGDVAAEARITGAVHLAHPAGAEQGDDFIGAKVGAGRERHSGF